MCGCSSRSSVQKYSGTRTDHERRCHCTQGTEVIFERVRTSSGGSHFRRECHSLSRQPCRPSVLPPTSTQRGILGSRLGTIEPATKEPLLEMSVILEVPLQILLKKKTRRQYSPSLNRGDCFRRCCKIDSKELAGKGGICSCYDRMSLHVAGIGNDMRFVS